MSSFLYRLTGIDRVSEIILLTVWFLAGGSGAETFGSSNVYFCFCKQPIRVSSSVKTFFVFYSHSMALRLACVVGRVL